jgi:hypothetical protein
MWVFLWEQINVILTGLRQCSLANKETDMAFNLTAHLARQQLALRTGMIKQAAREISACPCPEKRWQAIQLLKQMQRA